MNQNNKQMTTQPDDTAINIECGCSSTRSENNTPCDTSSLLDNASIISEEDYTAQVTSQNNMDSTASHFSLPLNLTLYNFVLPPFNPPHVSNKESLNSGPNYDTVTPMEPFPPMDIPYSANIPADPSLWDDNFIATFLFGTNKFLNSNVYSITCSLQHIACFLRQKNLKGYNGNNIKQLGLFGKSAWDFILAIFEAG